MRTIRLFLVAFLFLASELPLASGTQTLTFSQLQYGPQPYTGIVTVGGTGAVTVGACVNDADSNNVCGNGAFGFQLISAADPALPITTAPGRLAWWLNGQGTNTYPPCSPSPCTLHFTVSSTGFSDTVNVSYTIQPRTQPVVTTISGSFPGCSNTLPVFGTELDTCPIVNVLPGPTATPSTPAAAGSTITDANFGGVVRTLKPLANAQAIANDATVSCFNLDNTYCMTQDPNAGGIFATNRTTGANTWDFSVVPGCGGTCAPNSLNWSQTDPSKLYFFNFPDNGIYTMSLVTPPTTFSTPTRIYQYASGNQTQSQGITNGGEGVPAMNDYWSWATWKGTDRKVALTNLLTGSTVMADFSGLAWRDTVYTITGMSGNGVTPVHVTFTPALVADVARGGAPVFNFDSGAIGNTALNGVHCMSNGTGGATSMDCSGTTGNGIWLSGGSFTEACGNGTGFQTPPCSRGTTTSKGVDGTTGRRYVILSVDVGNSLDEDQIYSWAPGETSLRDDGHMAALSLAAQRQALGSTILSTYSGAPCDDWAWKNGNCYQLIHADTVRDANHEYVASLNTSTFAPFFTFWSRLDNPSLMLTPAELGGGMTVMWTATSTNPAGFHIGCSVTAPTCAYSTDQDPDVTTPFSISAISGNGISPIHVTSNYTGANGDKVQIFGITQGSGTSPLNNNFCTVANLSGGQFDCTGTGNGTYAFGGNIMPPTAPANNPHQGEVILMDGSTISAHQAKIKRIAKHRSWSFLNASQIQPYYGQAHASISPDGTQSAWESNWGFIDGRLGVFTAPTGFNPATSNVYTTLTFGRSTRFGVSIK